MAIPFLQDFDWIVSKKKKGFFLADNSAKEYGVNYYQKRSMRHDPFEGQAFPSQFQAGL